MLEGPFPPPLPREPPTELFAEFLEIGARLIGHAHWDFVDQLQDLFSAFPRSAAAPRDGAALGLGINEFRLRQDAPDMFTITAPHYRGDALRERTENLSEALWIHAHQVELARLTETALVASRLDHLIDLTPAARVALGTSQRLAMWRETPGRSASERATHTGWHIDLVEAGDAAPAAQITGAELARLAPAMVTALALPAQHLVLVDGAEFRGVWAVGPQPDLAAATIRTGSAPLAAWGPRRS